MRVAKLMAAGFVVAAVGVVRGQTDEAPKVTRPPRQFARKTVTPWFHEERWTAVLTSLDGKTTMSGQENTTATDSQGRRVEISTDLKTGVTHTHVADPVKGRVMAWSSAYPVVKVVNHPVAAPGRRSCWKVDNPPPLTINEALMSLQSFSCMPAEDSSPVGYCAAPSLAVPSKRPLMMGPPIGEADCERFLDPRKGVNQKVEDLGEGYVVGWPVHGCRVTAEDAKGPIVHEVWITAAPPENHWRLLMRSMMETPLPQGGTDRSTVEAEVFRNGSEPDETMFEPPKGYEMKVLATTEVSCDSFPVWPSAIVKQESAKQ